jgi:hypothetical protein
MVGLFSKQLADKFRLVTERKKINADVQGINIENIAKSVDLYKRLIDDIVPRYESQLTDYRAQLKEYNIKIDEYRNELKERDQEIVILHKELSEVTSRVLYLEKRSEV